MSDRLVGACPAMVGDASQTATYIASFFASDQSGRERITHEFYGYMPLRGCQGVIWDYPFNQPEADVELSAVHR